MQTATHLKGFSLQNALVTRAAELPAISTSVVDLTAVCIRDDWDIEDACEVIDADPLLLGALLREANSAVFASASLVDASGDAVVRLGAARIMAIAVEMGLERLLGNVDDYGTSAMTVFNHSYVTSIAAEIVRERSRVRIPQAFAAAALLHDIGEIILSHYLERTGGPALADIRDRHLGVIDAERAELDLDHCDVSAIVCRQWRMPEIIVRSVHHHHTPWTADEPISYAVSLADQIADSIAAPEMHEATADSLTVGRCLVELDLTDSTLTDLVSETAARLERYGRSY